MPLSPSQEIEQASEIQHITLRMVSVAEQYFQRIAQDDEVQKFLLDSPFASAYRTYVDNLRGYQMPSEQGQRMTAISTEYSTTVFNAAITAMYALGQEQEVRDLLDHIQESAQPDAMPTISQEILLDAERYLWELSQNDEVLQRVTSHVFGDRYGQYMNNLDELAREWEMVHREAALQNKAVVQAALTAMYVLGDNEARKDLFADETGEALGEGPLEEVKKEPASLPDIATLAVTVIDRGTVDSSVAVKPEEPPFVIAAAIKEAYVGRQDATLKRAAEVKFVLDAEEDKPVLGWEDVLGENTTKDNIIYATQMIEILRKDEALQDAFPDLVLQLLESPLKGLQYLREQFINGNPPNAAQENALCLAFYYMHQAKSEARSKAKSEKTSLRHTAVFLAIYRWAETGQHIPWERFEAYATPIISMQDPNIRPLLPEDVETLRKQGDSENLSQQD